MHKEKNNARLKRFMALIYTREKQNLNRDFKIEMVGG